MNRKEEIKRVIYPWYWTEPAVLAYSLIITGIILWIIFK